MVQEMANRQRRRCCGVGHAKPREIALHGGVQIDGTCLHELHEGQCGEGLAE
jgi:hypothetical protein